MTELIIRYAEPSGIVDKTVIPSEVVGELVRCKDCDIRNENGWCEFIGGYVHDGYCAWAKMKGGE